MRAFMSDAAARRRLELWWGVLNTAPVQAVRETRHIQAETEQRMPHVYRGPRALRLCATLPDIATGRFDRQAAAARAALTEALAAFVAEGE